MQRATNSGQEQSWKQCFRDPSQWWDCRNSKIDPAHPDRITKQPLWIDGLCIPPWVAAELRQTGISQTQDKEVDEVAAFVALLRACSKSKDLVRATRIHDDILRKGLLERCSDALVTIYAKCGALTKAKSLLDMFKSRDVHTWTALITGYAQKGQGQDALNCFDKMQHEGLSPDVVTYTCLLKACGSIRAADEGGKIHNEIAKQGLLTDNVVLGNALVDMYAKCGDLNKARQTLEELVVRNVISWTTLILGYAEHGEGEQAISCFKEMQREGLSPNAVTFACMLKACSSIGALDMGEKMHDEINTQGLLVESDVILGTALVDMYAKCGALTKARRVLEELHVRNVVSWNALISGYADHGKGVEALDCYEQMQREGLSPDAVTFMCVLKACGGIRAAEKGEKIHDEMAKWGFRSDGMLGTALVDMYAKCGALAKARQVLEELIVWDTISWNALMAGYVEQGDGEQALRCFEQMQDEGLSPDAMTFASLLTACGSMGAADKGERIENELSKQGWLHSDVVLGTALVDMYAKCGNLAKARRALQELPVRDIVCWNSLITGYTELGDNASALHSYEHMLREGISPDMVTFICALKACSSIGAVDKGERVHESILKHGLAGSDIALGTALVDMYAKCGAIGKARRVLEELSVRNMVSWNALIVGYAEHGDAAEALKCFEEMTHEGHLPDAATFTVVLGACRRLGLVEHAQRYFVSMHTKFAMKPDLEHYICMVDLLGRAGHLDRAIGVIERVQSSTSAVWSALLRACRKWADVDVGRWAFEHAAQVDKSNAAVYVLMAEIYTAAGMHKDAENIKKIRIEIGT